MTHPHLPDQRRGNEIEVVRHPTHQDGPSAGSQVLDTDLLSLVSARLTMAAMLVDSLEGLPAQKQPFVRRSALDYVQQALWMLQDLEAPRPGTERWAQP